MMMRCWQVAAEAERAGAVVGRSKFREHMQAPSSSPDPPRMRRPALVPPVPLTPSG